MQKATETKKQANRFDVLEGTAVVVMKEAASGRELARFDFDALPETIKLRLLAQGGSTILQQRKSGLTGSAAVEAMKAHYANWATGSWEMERKAARVVPAWVFPALCLKLPKIAPAKILAALETKRQEATPDTWAEFLRELQPYGELVRQQAQEAAEEDEGFTLD